MKIFSFEIWAENPSALPKHPGQTKSRLKREVYKVYRPETPEEIIEDEVEVGRYLSFIYFIHFHRLLLYRCERRCLRILTGALLACLCCSLLGSALMMMMWLNCLSQGKENTKKNKIISVLFRSANVSDRQYNSNNSDDHHRHNNNNNEYHHLSNINDYHNVDDVNSNDNNNNN